MTPGAFQRNSNPQSRRRTSRGQPFSGAFAALQMTALWTYSSRRTDLRGWRGAATAATARAEFTHLLRFWASSLPSIFQSPGPYPAQIRKV